MKRLVDKIFDLMCAVGWGWASGLYCEKHWLGMAGAMAALAIYHAVAAAMNSVSGMQK